MRSDVWQRLLALESRDAVCKWFEQLHGRELSARRALEITSAAKQAREFFRNSANSNDYVKPLLTFYGVAALSKSALLLLRRNGGEETLVGSHGVETVGWSTVLSGEIASGLKAIDRLTIRSTQGLFSEFLAETDNRMCMHVRSSAVDWRLSYPKPPMGYEFTLGALLDRLPDLAAEYERLGRVVGFAEVNTMTFSPEAGFTAKVRASPFENFKDEYASLGYSSTLSNDWYDVACDAGTFQRSTPQFSHTYVSKSFGTIPRLFIAKPFEPDVRYSQLALTYLLSYCLGMLARYYPTHWIALLSGAKGDEWWPAVSLAQKYVDVGFPELIAEFLEDTLGEAQRTRDDAAPNRDATPSAT